MTASSFARVWIASALLVTAAAAATIALGWNQPAIAFSLGPAKIAVIGTSLLRNAVPLAPVEGGLLGDGRPHFRIGVPNLTESEAVAALGQVVEEHADLVFLEANALVVDLKLRGGPSTEWAPTAWWSRNVSLPLRRGMDRLRGRNYAVDLAKESALTGRFKPKRAKLAKLYPLQLHDLADPTGFAHVVDEAKKLGARIVLIVPPRSRAAEDFMGSENQAALRSAFEQLATTYGLELWVFGPAWPNDLFSDHAHLNRAGRDRFVVELRHRYEAAS